MSEQSMADVLAGHAVYGMSGGTHLACRCNPTWVPNAEYRAHLEAALSAAGFGPVQEAKAEAWDEGYTIGNAHNGRRDANPYREQQQAPILEYCCAEYHRNGAIHSKHLCTRKDQP